MLFFCLVLLAISYWLDGNKRMFLFLSGVAIIVFRADVAILLGLFLCYDLFYKQITIAE